MGKKFLIISIEKAYLVGEAWFERIKEVFYRALFVTVHIAYIFCTIFFFFSPWISNEFNIIQLFSIMVYLLFNLCIWLSNIFSTFYCIWIKFSLFSYQNGYFSSSLSSFSLLVLNLSASFKIPTQCQCRLKFIINIDYTNTNQWWHS